MKRPIDTSTLGPVKLDAVVTARDRVKQIANGATINGTYKQLPGVALELFRKDLLELVDGQHYPTEDAYLAACRALHWRTAQLRAAGHEPIAIPTDASHYPPDDYDWSVK